MFRADEEDDYDDVGPREEGIMEEGIEEDDDMLELEPHAGHASRGKGQESPSKSAEGGDNENENEEENEEDGWDDLDELDRDDEMAGTYDRPEDDQGEEAGTLNEDQDVDHEAQEAERKRRIVMAMTEQQLERYESFRRSSLARPTIKRMMTSLLGYSLGSKAVIALSGMGKVFVGELVEAARVIASEEGHQGALLPSHIHRAYQTIGSSKRAHKKLRLKL